jgi:hypothetical protein
VTGIAATFMIRDRMRGAPLFRHALTQIAIPLPVVDVDPTGAVSGLGPSLKSGSDWPAAMLVPVFGAEYRGSEIETPGHHGDVIGGYVEGGYATRRSYGRD